MSQQQLTLLETIRIVHRETYAPVTTVAVATRCYMTDRYARKLLAKLAEQGAVQRVGSRRGWMPIAA